MRGFPNFNDTIDKQRRHWFKICELKGITLLKNDSRVPYSSTGHQLEPNKPTDK